MRAGLYARPVFIWVVNRQADRADVEIFEKAASMPIMPCKTKGAVLGAAPLFCANILTSQK